MPKVVHFLRLYRPHIGGVETHVENLNRQLVADGWQALVITQKIDQNAPFYQNDSDEEIYRLPAKLLAGKNWLIRLWGKILWWRQIWKVRSVWLSADIIQIHDVFFWILPFWPLIYKKVFMTFHGYEGNSHPSWRSRFWHYLAYKMSRGNLCIGGFHQKWYGVRPTQISFGAVQLIKAHRKRKKNNFVFVGRLENDNGLMVILRALKLWRARCKDSQGYRLDVYGHGSLLSSARQYARKHRLSVNFLGIDPQVRHKIGSYQLAFASHYLSILEALGSGTPVIAYSLNKLTDDYLKRSKFVKWIEIVHTSQDIVKIFNQLPAIKIEQRAIVWARQQTWGRLKRQYYQLWNWKL